ncbi:MAG TPA: hypothetical protein VLQ93_13110 [Myxococcaceae bacterium]|nr:hypothetical protein [Myxococcaceae bacterium]
MLRRMTARRSRGFTTVEAMIASVVFLVGLAGLLGALIQARGATGQARRILEATDIANDLMAQVQLWPFEDPRLASSLGTCAADPQDVAGVLLEKPGDPARASYVACMHDENMLRLNGAHFGGLDRPVFTDADGSESRFERYYITKTEDVRPGVRRRQIWGKVLYEESGQTRVVSSQTMRIQMGGVL